MSSDVLRGFAVLGILVMNIQSFSVIYTDIIQECFIVVVSIFIGYKAFMLPNHAEVLSFAGSGWSSFALQWTAEPMT